MPDIPLDPLLLPMALCADAEVKDGALVGDPTEGALVVLAAKGGVDPTLTRERYPRVATLPFDAAYKFMATFHRMEDDSGKPVIRAFVKGAPDQLLARATWAQAADGTAIGTRPVREPISRRERAPWGAGSARAGHGPSRLRPGDLRSERRPAPAHRRPGAPGTVGIVDPPRAEARTPSRKAKSAGIRSGSSPRR